MTHLELVIHYAVKSWSKVFFLFCFSSSLSEYTIGSTLFIEVFVTKLWYYLHHIIINSIYVIPLFCIIIIFCDLFCYNSSKFLRSSYGLHINFPFLLFQSMMSIVLTSDQFLSLQPLIPHILLFPPLPFTLLKYFSIKFQGGKSILKVKIDCMALNLNRLISPSSSSLTTTINLLNTNQNLLYLKGVIDKLSIIVDDLKKSQDMIQLLYRKSAKMQVI